MFQQSGGWVVEALGMGDGRDLVRERSQKGGWLSSERGDGVNVLFSEQVTET